MNITQRLRSAINILGRTKRLAEIRKPELEAFMGAIRRSIRAARLEASTPGILSRQPRKSMLVWCADHEDIMWPKPSGFGELLMVDTSKPMTDAEREAQELRAFNPDNRFFSILQLQKTIYRHADSRMRAFILLGLNCAYYPTDIGFLQVSKIKTNGTSRIETTRRKTNTPCRHVLWRRDPPCDGGGQGYAQSGRLWYFLNARGRPYQGTSVKLIPKLWCDLRRQAGKPDALDFKFLRLTLQGKRDQEAGWRRDQRSSPRPQGGLENASFLTRSGSGMITRRRR